MVWQKIGSPDGDIKSAQALLDEIPKGDALKALPELTTWVESVREQAEFRWITSLRCCACSMKPPAR